MGSGNSLRSVQRALMRRFYWSAGPERGKGENPTWQEIEDALRKVGDGPGFVSIDVLDQSKGGEVTYINGKRYRSLGDPVNSLQLHAEKGYFMLMLGEPVDGEWCVRTYNKPGRDPASAGAKMAIMGDYWSVNELCRDPDVVVRIFREFFETGDVSEQLMD